MTNRIKIELVNDAYPGVTFGITVSDEGDKATRSFADEPRLAAFAEALSARSQLLDRDIFDMGALRPGFDPDRVYISSISVDADPFSLRKFSVEMPDGISEAAHAPDYATATLVAALKHRFMGAKFADLLLPAEEILSDLKAIRTERNLLGKEGLHCEFEVADWRVRELADDDLSGAQKAPMTFSVADYGYGPAAFFRRGDEEYAVVMEIDRGCVVARASPVNDDTLLAGFRIARDSMQVEMTGPESSYTFMMDGEGVALDRATESMTQDDDLLPAPTA